MMLNAIHGTVEAANAVQEQLDAAAAMARSEIYAARLGGLGIDRTVSFSGEPEMAFLHFFGEAAFAANNYRPFEMLTEELVEAADPLSPLPVLFANYTELDRYGRNLAGTRSTSLALLEPGNITFQSLVRYRAPGNAITDEPPTDTPAYVTARVLGVKAQVATLESDISTADEAPDPADIITNGTVLSLYTSDGIEYNTQHRLEEGNSHLRVVDRLKGGIGAGKLQAIGWTGIERALHNAVWGQRHPFAGDFGNGPTSNSPNYQLAYFEALAASLELEIDDEARVEAIRASLAPHLAQ